jgi:hypothetical protein
MAMASRKYQISEKFSYHGIEKISDIGEIQLPYRENIGYLRNFDTMASIKLQISDI